MTGNNDAAASADPDYPDVPLSGFGESPKDYFAEDEQRRLAEMLEAEDREAEAAGGALSSFEAHSVPCSVV